MKITTKKVYKEFIKKECGNPSFFKCYLQSYLKYRPTQRFILLLRTCEYYKNCKKNFFNKFLYFLIKNQKYRLGLKLNFTIPENVFGKGLQLPHYGTIIVNANARIGKNCRIHACTNIGASNNSSNAPKIGDNVYIAPGVKIYGDIIIADNVSIAANAAVSKNFLEENKIIGGVPAKVIGNLNV